MEAPSNASREAVVDFRSVGLQPAAKAAHADPEIVQRHRIGRVRHAAGRLRRPVEEGQRDETGGLFGRQVQQVIR